MFLFLLLNVIETYLTKLCRLLRGKLEMHEVIKMWFPLRSFGVSGSHCHLGYYGNQLHFLTFMQSAVIELSSFFLSFCLIGHDHQTPGRAVGC